MNSLKSSLIALLAAYALLSVSYAGESKDAKACGDCQGSEQCCSSCPKAEKSDDSAKSAKTEAASKEDDEKKC